MLKKIILFLIAAFIISQFYRPKENRSSETPASDFLEVTNANSDISAMIKNSCYDCHSNNTNYPWYSKVAPVSWMMAHHVDEGKEELDFSKWSTFSAKRKKKKIKEMIDELKEREMPLKMYLPMHSEAKLSDAQINELITWLKKLQ